MDEPTPTPTTGRHPRHVGVVLLVVAAVSSLGVIAWGIGGSTATTVATLEPVQAQWASVDRGDLVESTRVSAIVSRGEIISLAAPTMSGGGGPAGTSGAPSAGASGAPSATATPTTTAPPATAPPATVPPATVPPATVPATTTTTAAPPTWVTAPPTSVAPSTSTTGAPATTVPATTVPPSTAPSTTAPAVRTTTTTTTGATARVVTGISPIGTVLGAGATAFSVDGRSTVVLPGFVPAWRAIDSSTTDGVDVTQLESFLAGAGFDADGALVVDEEVDDATVRAIEDWQESLGLEPSGRIELGEVVFLAGDVTVVATNAKVGTVLDAGDTVLDVRSGTPYVDVSTDASWVKVGDQVDVSLGDSSARGTVSTFSSGIARVALPATTTVRDGSAATVKLRRTKVDGELLVPASAVLRTDLAGPTVAVRDGDDRRRVRVEVLAAANGTAAVRAAHGDRLVEGDTVARY